MEMKKEHNCYYGKKATAFSIIQYYFSFYDRILILLFITLILSSESAGQIIFHDTKGHIEKKQMLAMFQEAKYISDSLKRIKNDAYLLDIMYRGKDIILFINGFFDVYQWKNNTWQQKNKPRKGGFNFGGKKFIWNNRIFSFGGYGYWTRHGDLIEFDMKKGDWHKVELNGTLPIGIMYTTSKGFRVLSDACYEVNMHTRTFKKFPLELPFNIDTENIYYGIKLETAHWAYLLQGGNNIVLHKQEDKIYYSDVRTRETVKGFVFNHNDFVHCKKDSVMQWNPDGTMLKGFNIQKHVAYYKKFDLRPKKDSAFNLLLYASLILGLSIAIHFWNTVKKKQQKKSGVWQNPLIPALIAVSGTQVTTEQLDQLLEIEDVTPLENRKYKRSRMLQEINKEYEIKVGKTLITRRKDLDDGRKFIYEINIR